MTPNEWINEIKAQMGRSPVSVLIHCGVNNKKYSIWVRLIQSGHVNRSVLHFWYNQIALEIFFAQFVKNRSTLNKFLDIF